MAGETVQFNLRPALDAMMERWSKMAGWGRPLSEIPPETRGELEAQLLKILVPGLPYIIEAACDSLKEQGWTEPAPEPADPRPHSRACGIRRHDHGLDCHTNCPTCHGKAAVQMVKCPLCPTLLAAHAVNEHAELAHGLVGGL